MLWYVFMEIVLCGNLVRFCSVSETFKPYFQLSCIWSFHLDTCGFRCWQVMIQHVTELLLDNGMTITV